MQNNGHTHFSSAEISASFLKAGIPVPPNLPIRLRQLTSGKSAPLVTPEIRRFGLSIFGTEEVKRFLSAGSGLSTVAPVVERLTGNIAGDAEQRFYAEVVACVKTGSRRAAMVMIWLLTVDHLQRYVLGKKLSDFNNALSKRTDHKGLQVSSMDHFAELRDDKAFIEILRSSGVITNDVRKILDEKLGFRNSCAHPADIEITDLKVVSSVEDLVLNVILKYPL